MKRLIFIHGAKCEEGKASPRFAMRLDRALEIGNGFREQDDEAIFMISGRSSNSEAGFVKPEAVVGREYLLAKVPDARVICELVSVETIGNLAFSKPVIRELNVNKVVVLHSALNRSRVEYLAPKIFGKNWEVAYEFLEDEIALNEALWEREKKALTMVKSLLDDIPDGDDAKARDVLLYGTPFYIKGLVDDRSFFDTYWEGGFDDFLKFLKIRKSS